MTRAEAPSFGKRRHRRKAELMANFLNKLWSYSLGLLLTGLAIYGAYEAYIGAMEGQEQARAEAREGH